MADTLIRLRRLLAIVTLFVASMFVWNSAATGRVRLSRDRKKNPRPGAEESRTSGLVGSVSNRRFIKWMSRLSHPAREESGEQEWMDLPGNDPHELTEMFQDLRRVNHWLGGWRMTARGLGRFITQFDVSQPARILDVATGSADIPYSLARWAREQGHEVTIIATDRNPAVLKMSKDCDCSDTVELVAADALKLPFADNAFDVTASSFFLHHLAADEAVAALREMSRVSRHGVLINDIVRSWSSYLGAWIFTRVFTRNEISRHDAVLSARRAYTSSELVELARLAGLEPEIRYSFAGYRIMMALRFKECRAVPMEWSRKARQLGPWFPSIPRIDQQKKSAST